jgi:non-ribosomal peptide synthetase component F
MRVNLQECAASGVSHDPYLDSFPALSVPAWFERIVAAYPDNLAVGGTDWQPTFGELNLIANRVAHAILRSGAAAGDRVAILMEHDAPMAAALIGVLKAGCVAAVFNAADPPMRHKQLIESAEPAVLLVAAACRAAGVDIAGNATVLCFDQVASNGPTDNPAFEISADRNALIMYTSGSTGQPNGVMWTHDSLIANARMAAWVSKVTPSDRVLLLASVGGGQGTNTLLTAVLSGASVWPFSAQQKGVHGLADYVAENAITVCVWSPSIFRHMAMTIRPDRRFPSVRSVRLSSEGATQQDFRIFERHFSDRCRLNHVLSSSETGAIAFLTLRPGDDVGEGALPVGRLFDGVTVELLDEAGRPAPDGEPGQLVVTSRSVAVGYWRNPELTAKRRFSSAGSQYRTVCTRDLARWNDTGMLEFVGRLERRVKIRGYTIELPEVEQALRTLPGLKAVVCSVFELPMCGPQLVASIVQDRTTDSNAGLHSATLRRQLRALLPRQMIPSTFVLTDELPLNASGKIDPGKLRELYEVRERNQSDRPTTDTELMIARIWGSALSLDDIGRHDDFFDLGGDSLTASVATASLQAEAGVEIDLGTFVAHSTVATMAELVGKLRSRTLARQGPKPAASTQFQEPAPQPLVPQELALREPALYEPTLQEPAPLSFAQQFYWETSQTAEAAAQHTGVGHVRLVGSLDRSALQAAMVSLFERYEMLRTSFREMDGQVVQIVDPTAALPLAFSDVSSHADPVISAQALLGDDRKRGFDLRRSPLVMFRLIRLNEREYWLSYASHHIVADAFSWRIFIRDLADCYDAEVNGADGVRFVVRRFADFARWQRAEFQPNSPKYRDALIGLIDEHLRGAFPKHTTYRNWLLWCLRRSYPKKTIQSTLIGFLLRTLFALPPPPAKPLPFRRQLPAAEANPTDGLIVWRLSSEVVRRLSELARDQGASYAAVRLATCAVALSEAIGSDAVAIATQFTNRSQPETRNVFGFCANPMAFALDCDGGLTFREFVRVVRDKLHRLQTQSRFPYDELQRIMHAWKIKPLRNAIHVNMATAAPPIRTRDLQLIKGEDSLRTPTIEFKFAALNDDRDDQLGFNAQLYDPAAIRDFADLLVRLFDVASRNPDLRLSELLAMSRRPAG